jgi:hypothetical protein
MSTIYEHNLQAQFMSTIYEIQFTCTIYGHDLQDQSNLVA